MNLLDILTGGKLHKKKYFWLLTSILITIVVLSPNLWNNFLNWDDPAYVINNDLIKDFSFKGIKNIFTTPEVVSTYAPLTLLSWSIDYAIGGLNATGFHITNLLLHIIVVSLVFYLVKLLSKNEIVAFIAALFFGIHPMHVEVVGWISARKDLLYSMFFLAGLICYYFYIEKEHKFPKSYLYIGCLALYLLSLLSKGTAVIFPLVLFLFDYLKNRKDIVKLLIEKTPFFILSIVFVYVSITMQDVGGAMEDRELTSFIDSLSVGFYGYFTYLLKSVIPFHLSAYHPYPNELGQSNPWYFYAAAIPVLTLFTFIITRFKKDRNLVFGFGFFFISLIPVIQVLPFGTAVMAERYTYLPYFGLFYLFGLWLVSGLESKFNKILIYTLPIYVVVLSIITFQYSRNYKNGETLWTAVIEKYPKDFLGYMNRCNYRMSKGQYDDALLDANTAIKQKKNSHWLYYNRALANKGNRANDLALKDFNMAIRLDSTFLSAYLNRGVLYGSIGKYDNAINDFSKVISINPVNPIGYYNRAIYYNKLQQYDKALIDLAKVISFNELLPQSFFTRGEVYMNLRQIDKAISNFSNVILYDSKMATAYTKRGTLLIEKRKLNKALKDFEMAISIDENQIDAHINKGFVLMNQSLYNKAALSFKEAKRLDPKNYTIYYNNALLFQLTENYELALKEFNACLAIKPDYLPAIEAKNEVLSLLK